MKESALSKRIAKALKHTGKSNEDLAQALGVNKNTIAAYKNEKGDLKGIVLVGLVEKFNFNPDWLLAGKEPMVFGEKEAQEFIKEALLDTAASPESAALETEVLAQVIEGVEEFLRDEEKELEPDTKARLISLLYEHFSKAKEEPNQKTIENYLKLVA